MATDKATRPPALHDADRHDLIRVHGARVNNLKDVSVEIPKRRLTVFTGVSGSGKSSLVFGTIAAESQRLINETYSAFVQGFMPTLARPEVDVLEGLTTAIIVDQERMGANPRSTVGTATDANAMLRILFSRLGKPHIGPPTAYSFNVPTRHGERVDDRRARARGERIVVRKASSTTAACARAARAWARSPTSTCRQLYDDSKSLNEGALTIPGYSMDGWYGRIFRGCGFFDPDKPIRKFTKKELHDLLHKEPTKIKVDGHQPDVRGSDPADPEVVPVQGRRRDAAAHPRLRGAGGDVHDLSRLRRHPAQRGGPVVEDQGQEHRRRLLDADQRPGRLGPRTSTNRRWRRCSPGCSTSSTRSRRSGWATSRSTGRRAPSPGGEAQRTKMIRHLGSSLTDVTYVFDEPTIGLHPHDIQRMNDLLLQLRDKGNTVLVVEHKPEAIAIADHVVDLGPGAGTAGGTVCFEGTVEGLRASDTITGRHLDDRATLKESVRSPSGDAGGPRRHRRTTCRTSTSTSRSACSVVVTGVAGSGKSSLIHGSVAGRDGVVAIDQGAIRGSRRSNPATYTGLLDPIRKAFAKANGVKPALFSSNSEGACPTCNGAGVIYTDLGVMATVESTCEECEGKRFQACGARVHASAAGTSARCSRCR